MGECKFCNFSLHDSDMFDEETEYSKKMKYKGSLEFKDGKSKIELGLNFQKYDNSTCIPPREEDFQEYRIIAEIWINNEFGIGKPIRVNYCPMCGRNLLKEAVETND